MGGFRSASRCIYGMRSSIAVDSGVSFPGNRPTEDSTDCIARTVGNSETRPEIVRIGHPVKNQKQRRHGDSVQQVIQRMGLGK